MQFLAKLFIRLGFVPLASTDAIAKELIVTKAENEALKKLLAQKSKDNKVLVDTVQKLVK